MAMTFDSMTVRGYHPAHAAHPGKLIATVVTGASADYLTGGFTLTLALLMANGNLGGFNPATQVKQVTLMTRLGYRAEWTPAASPTPTSMGTILFYTSGGTQTANATAFNAVSFDLILDLDYT